MQGSRCFIRELESGSVVKKKEREREQEEEEEENEDGASYSLLRDFAVKEAVRTGFPLFFLGCLHG